MAPLPPSPPPLDYMFFLVARATWLGFNWNIEQARITSAVEAQAASAGVADELEQVPCDLYKRSIGTNTKITNNSMLRSRLEGSMKGLNVCTYARTRVHVLTLVYVGVRVH